MGTALAAVATTSSQRTYRYLRIGIAGCVVIIAIAVIIANVQLRPAAGVLPSISAYFYSPARDIFVGALIAASIGILALSGRGFERAALDAAALFAPLIGVIPTRVDPGTIPGLRFNCEPGVDRCVPAEMLPTIANGVLTYVAVGFAALVVALVVAANQRSLRASAPTLVLAFVVILGVAATWTWAQEFFLTGMHTIVSGVFFALIALVALRNVAPFPGEHRRRPLVKALFCLIGVGAIADVIALVLVSLTVDDPGSTIFFLEFTALGLFFVFWILQSGRNWSLVDAPYATAIVRSNVVL